MRFIIILRKALKTLLQTLKLHTELSLPKSSYASSKKLCTLIEAIELQTEKLKSSVNKLESEEAVSDSSKLSVFLKSVQEKVIFEMDKLRELVDSLEEIVPNWPYPKYSEILFEDFN